MSLSAIVVLGNDPGPETLELLQTQAADLRDCEVADLVLIRPDNGVPLDPSALADLQAIMPTSEVADGVDGLDGAFRSAAADGRDILLFEAGFAFAPGALRELVAVAALDHMTACVGPRTDVAGPDARLPAGSDPAALRDLVRRLPRVRYVPAAPESCLCLNRRIVQEFGPIDLGYATWRGRVADLVQRANRCGYRAILANHALATPPPGAPSGDDEADRARLGQRHPELARALARAAASPDQRAETLLAGLRPNGDGRLRVAFDATHLWNKSGTTEAALRLVEHASAAWADRFTVEVIATPEIFRDQGFGRIANVTRAAPPGEDAEARDPPAVVVRIGQPFAPADIGALRRAAPVEVVTVLDVIALDCAELDDRDFATLWQGTFRSADALVFISAYTAAQARARLRVPEDVLARTSLLSLDLREYAGAAGDEAPREPPYILVVGNAYPHKHAVETTERIRRARPDLPVVLLGADLGQAENFRSYGSGALDDGFVDRLYAGARCVVYPSHYEGFGFPPLHALARGKPVIVRRMPVFAELQAVLGLRANLHTGETTDDIVRLATDPDLAWVDETVAPAVAAQGWARCAADYRQVIEEALAGFDYERLVRRIEIAESVQQAAEASEVLQRQEAAAAAALRAATDSLAHALYRIEHLEAAVAWWKGDVEHFQAEAQHWTGEAARSRAEAQRWAEACASAEAETARMRADLAQIGLREVARLGYGAAGRHRAVHLARRAVRGLIGRRADRP